MCIQKNYLYNVTPEVEGKEDCLYLNVYTPRIPNFKGQSISQKYKLLLPVMVFIHYGGFFAGTGNSDYLGPEYFMDKNVILVTFNYRLGVFGFLSTNDDASPGNYGLKDQVAALKWVQENIQSFGGNNKRVIIFGQSAGAGSVHYHMLSSRTANLFHGAISQSGSTLAQWARPHNELQLLIAQQQALFVGCGDSVNNTHDMIECLRKVDAETLADSSDLFKTILSSEPFLIYAPVTEKQTPNNPHPYITEDPLTIIQTKKFHKVPWITGVVSDEGILRAAPLLRQSAIQEQLNANMSLLGPALMGLQLSLDYQHIPHNWNKIAKTFLKGDSINVNSIESVQGFIDLYSDRVFNYAAYQSALLHAKNGHNPIWFYNFAYRGRYSYGDLFAATEEKISFAWGVSHCDDLLYLFPSSKLFEPLKSKNDLLMSKIMIHLWTNFAIYGHPTPNHEIHAPRWNPLPNLEGLKVVKNSDLCYMNITGPYKSNEGPPIQLDFDNRFYPERMSFWGKLPLKENVDDIE
ncbi:hypothetical protein ILUMI_17796 [Ignelater luminosus]|uniref:Carboxylic ester hydrolase n=1 Tax=Ignelater luminosus TaxID=2038154 RepID=A0A8K0G769_IGNLU|nr:hypothetical protein ILUMI_17796 [Ignelater luminosus]